MDAPLAFRAVEDRNMRWPRVRLRTIMMAVAFLALVLTVVIQSVRLQEALVREQQHLAFAEYERARAEVLYRKTQAILGEMNAGITEEQGEPPVAATRR